MRHLLLSALIALASPALAREVTSEDRETVAALIADFTEVIEIGDMPGLIGFIPPPMITTIAEANGIPEDTLMEILAGAMAQAMEGVTVERFEMDLAAGTEGETSAGRPYIAIPTTNVMRIDGSGTATATSTTLALEDEGRWYITRIDDATQLAILRDTYPDFAGIEFPAGTMEFSE